MRGLGTGKLDTRIKIYRVTTTNTYGATDKVYTLLASVAAKYKPVYQDEVYNKEMVTTVADAEFVVRYSSITAGINAADEIEYNGQKYDLISAPVQIGRREFISLKVRLRDSVNG